MDHKDLVVIGLTILCGLGGSTFGPVGTVAGILIGAGIGATWASHSDRVEYLAFERE